MYMYIISTRLSTPFARCTHKYATVFCAHWRVSQGLLPQLRVTTGDVKPPSEQLKAAANLEVALLATMAEVCYYHIPPTMTHTHA
jgi:hypothetical protein